MLADNMVISYFNLGYCTSYYIDDPVPELAAEWLGLRNGTPVITAMFIFAGNLAVVTAVALRNIDNQYFTHGYFLCVKRVLLPAR